MASEQSLSYRDAGVDTHAGQAFVRRIQSAVQSTARPEWLRDRGGFAGLFDVSFLKSYRQPLLVSSTDGVGTKLRLAQLFDRHETIGIDLVAMCVNDLLVSGANPLFFLDYIATGKLSAERLACVVESIAAGCRQAGCTLLGGETAEHPDTMAAEDYDLGGFVVGAVEADRLIDGSRVAAGDVILGLPSSGIHSNGMSLVRRIFLKEGLQLPANAADQRFLRDEILLRPTLIYEPVVRPLLEEGAPIRAMAHITGGGFYENAARMLGDTLTAQIDAGSWTPPELFLQIADRGPVLRQEMFSVFNMGMGLLLYVPESEADATLARLKETMAAAPTPALGAVRRIGRVVPRQESAVEVRF
ncbi:MAG: phosphoribosylformylglycinamidine cyclo-ligase [Leptospirales bacterium]|nr:phosphoribosylformylglycinamidine cyclo-ligase [Leptospirales bacterium]